MTGMRQVPFRLNRGYAGLLPRLVLLIGFLVISSSTLAQTHTEGSNVVKCFVSILPQEFFVSRIGDPYVAINVLVGPGQEPHTFELTPKAMTSLAQADLFFAVGLPFEKVIIKKLAGMSHKVRIIDTTVGIPFLSATMHHEHDHHHDTKDLDRDAHGDKDSRGHEHNSQEAKPLSEEHKQSHLNKDPHIWLDPKLVKIQAENIAEALITQDADHASHYKDNLKKFQQELDDLDAELANALAPYNGRKFFVYHPAFGYFAARYGLVQVPVEVGGKEPTAKYIAEIVKSAKEEGIRIIFVEPQFSKKSAEIIAKAIGGSVVLADPLNRDYLNNLRALGTSIKQSMEAMEKASGK